jgi:hypothetical protein
MGARSAGAEGKIDIVELDDRLIQQEDSRR